MIPRRRAKRAQRLGFSLSRLILAPCKWPTCIVYDTGFLYNPGKGV
jgi:hypothetical protein